MIALEARGISKELRASWRHAPAMVVRDVCFDVARGEALGLLGPNGAGKTTTIQCLLGILRPTRGEALLFGRGATESEARRRVGYLPEAFDAPAHHTARSLLTFWAALSGVSPENRVRRIVEVLNRQSIGGLADRPVSTFSKGQLQRLGLAQAVLHEPDLVILDEPTANLDPVGRKEVSDLVRDLKKQGKAVLVSSHILSEIESVCDRVAILDAGAVVRSAPLAELCATESLESAFLRAIGRAS